MPFMKNIIKLRLRTKWMVYDMLNFFGWTPRLNQKKGEVRVLCFHGICKDSQPYINGRFLKLGRFRMLLNTLNANYNIISLEDFLLHKISDEKLNILITFDDGYRNLKTMMTPVINELRIPVTLFITCRNEYWMDLLDIAEHQSIGLQKLEKDFPAVRNCKSNAAIKNWAKTLNRTEINHFTALLWDILGPKLKEYEIYYEILDKRELKEMAANEMISLANHGAHHLSFQNLNLEEMHQEVLQCREYLRDIDTQYSNIFAYPFGDYDERSYRYLRSVGIEHQFIVDQTDPIIPKRYERLVINPFISIHNQLIAIENGRY